MGEFEKFKPTAPAAPSGGGEFAKFRQTSVPAPAKLPSAINYKSPTQVAPAAQPQFSNPSAETQRFSAPEWYQVPGQMYKNVADIVNVFDPKTWAGGLATNARLEAGPMVQGLAVMGSNALRAYGDTYTPPFVYQPELMEEFMKKPSANPMSWVNPFEKEGTFEKALLPKGAPFTPRRFAEDVGNVGKQVQAVGEDYWRYYGKPIAEGHPERILTNMYGEPIRATLDIGGLKGGAKTAARAAYAKSPVVRMTALTGKTAAKALGRTTFEVAAELIKEVPVVGEWFAGIPERAAAFKAALEIDRDFVQKVMPIINEMKLLYDAAERALKDKGLDPRDLISAGEYRNFRKGVSFRQIPEVKALFERANELNDLIAEKLMERGAFTYSDYMKAKYGNHALNTGLSTDLSNKVMSPQQLAELEAAKADLAAAGIGDAVFSSIQSIADVQRSLKLKGGLFSAGDIGKKIEGHIESWQRERVVDLGRGARQDFRSSHFHDNFTAYHLKAQAWLGIKEVFAKIIENKNLPDGAAEVHLGRALKSLNEQAGFSPEAATKLVEDFNLSKIETSETVAKTLNAMLGMLTGKEGSFLNKAAGINDALTSIYVQLMLKMNIHWANAQSLQNQFVVPMAMFKDPKDALSSIMAYRIAFDPEFDSWMRMYAPELMQDARTMPITDHVMKNMAKFDPLFDKLNVPFSSYSARAVSSVAGSLQWYMERVGSVAARGDNFARLTLMAHNLMAAAEADPALRIPLGEALDMQARQLQIAKTIGMTATGDPPVVLSSFKQLRGQVETTERVASEVGQIPGNPAVAQYAKAAEDAQTRMTELMGEISKNPEEAIAKRLITRQEADTVGFKVKPILPERMQSPGQILEGMVEESYIWLGKYRHAPGSLAEKMRGTFPFFYWWVHSFSIAKALPTRSPLKAAAIARLMAVQPKIFQPEDLPTMYKKLGAVPVLDKEGKPIRDRKGHYLVRIGQSWMPLMQPVELVQQMEARLTPGIESEGLPVMNVGWNFVLMFGAAVNPSNLRPFYSPRFTYIRGKLAGKEGAKGHPLSGNPPLPLVNLFPRLIDPALEAQLRKAASYPYVPSDVSNFWDQAARSMKGKNLQAFAFEDPRYATDQVPADKRLLDIMRQGFMNVGKVEPTVVRKTEGEARKQERYFAKEYRRAKRKQRTIHESVPFGTIQGRVLPQQALQAEPSSETVRRKR